MKQPAPKVVCTDGFRMSVQASVYMMCEPKTDNAMSYKSVEIGYPSKHEPLLDDFIDSDGIAGYVPIELVDEIIQKHGGFIEKLP